MKKFFTKILTVVVALFVAGNVYAQVTTSALSGVVVDDQNVEVVGVAVVATHTPSGTNYWAVTNGSGVYSIEGMRPGGPYTIEFAVLGYQPLRLTDVTLSLGETYKADATLTTASELLDEVVISASSSKFTTERTGASINWKDNADEQAKLYDAFVAQDSYLSSHKGQYAEAYAARAPWVNRFDFRWAHNFKFNIGKTEHNFQLTADILNIGNMFNSSWGVYKNNDISNNSRILKYEGVNAAGEPTFSLAKNANKDYVSQSYDYYVNRTQCWQIQFGLRYLFN